ncbi:MAG: glycosyltransferase family 39 protein [Candidatus Omnitrophota bacterium]
MKHLSKYIPPVLLCIFFFLSFGGLLRESVTVDEFYHLPSGYSYLKTGTFRLGNNNPPLGKMLAAIPLLIRNVELPRTASFDEGNAWAYGDDFMSGHKRDYIRLFRDARFIILLIGVLGGCFVFLWAKELYGLHAAYLALFLYALCPNLLAHSHLVTTDVAASTFFIAALYFIFRWTTRRTWSSAVIAGVVLGLAQLTKFTELVLYAIMMIYLISLAAEEKHITRKDWLQIALIVVLSVLILNAGYLFQGSFTPLRDFHFSSGIMRGLSESLPGGFRLPLPYDYLAGFDFQKFETENESAKYFQFLMGRVSEEGWWYYYLVAFIFKVPVMFLVLLVMCVVLRFSNKLPRLSSGEQLILWAIILYAFMTAFGKLNVGFRYMLPTLPLLYVLVSRVVLIKLKTATKTVLFSLALLLYAAESLSVAPHFLSFFNLLAGTAKNGYHFLIDSNIDWGQDLPALKEYMDRQKIDTIDLAYFGNADPAIYGIHYKLLEKGTRGKRVAVSVNYYQGYPYLILKEDSNLFRVPPFYYTYLHRYPVRARIGYSMLIIEIP